MKIDSDCMGPMETFEARAARLDLNLSDCAASRLESLQIAAPLVDDATLRALHASARLCRRTTIVLPAGRYAHCSRARGWCRQGRNGAATWGERVDGGYRVGPSKWLVYSSDGFRREERVEWTVAHILVGTESWTMAD